MGDRWWVGVDDGWGKWVGMDRQWMGMDVTFRAWRAGQSNVRRTSLRSPITGPVWT